MSAEATDGVSQTIVEKIWDAHLVHREKGKPDVLYIDLHLVHEVTSPQAFEGLRIAGRTVRRPDLTVATADHNIPTSDRSLPIADPISKAQIDTLESNTSEFGITYFGMHDPRQGIVHVIGPELGLTQPGMTIVCGDSHTSTHGAFGALAFGIGTSEVEHVLATQCLTQSQPRTMAVNFAGSPGQGVTAKDLILGVISELGVSGGIGYVIEYRGEAIRDLSMEGRMTVCNMSIELGARAGLIAPDQTTFEYLDGLPYAPEGAVWDEAVEYWRSLPSDEGSTYDREIEIDISSLSPYVTWGTTPGMSVQVTGVVPSPSDVSDPANASAIERSLAYMGLKPGTAIVDIPIDRVFIGSCTNGRIEDLRSAAKVVAGHQVATSVKAMVVPGSSAVKAMAEREGLDKIFKDAGFEWREAGCSMCLGMNPDVLEPEERAASTSNRNFEGRQGRGGRTHLVSPDMAAAASIAGHFVDVREWDFK